ncbi:hypothetical protein [Allocoleopsis sp.]
MRYFYPLTFIVQPLGALNLNQDKTRYDSSLPVYFTLSAAGMLTVVAFR